MNTHFATSQRNDMRPLAFEGLPATDCHDQLQAFLAANQAYLAQHGMPDALVFLAEPMHDSATGKIDWYTSAKERPVPLAELSEPEQQALLAKTEQYLDAMRALAEKGAKRHDIAASFLSLATMHPDKQDIYSAGGTPVLINWGFDPSLVAHPENIIRLGEKERTEPVRPEPAPEPEQKPGPEAQPVPEASAIPGPVPVQSMTQAADTAATPPPVPPAASTAYAGCLPFLLPLLLALLLLWLILAIAGLVPSPLPASCFHQAVPSGNEPATGSSLEERIDNEHARSRVLAEKADSLNSMLKEHQALCLPREEPKPAAEAPVTPPENPAREEPAPPNPPKEESKPLAESEMPDFGTPPAVPETRQKGEALQIPEEAARKKDLSFLEGCWRSVTGLKNSLTGRPITAEYCFSANGKGHRKVTEDDGKICKGSLKASFSGSKLTIKARSAHCPDGKSYVPQKVICDGTEYSTQCHGLERNDDGSDHTWDAGFVRK